jgi:hypothetical protein
MRQKLPRPLAGVCFDFGFLAMPNGFYVNF